MATKDKNSKKSEFPSPGGLGVFREEGKNSNTVKTQKLHTSGRTKIPGQELDNSLNFRKLRP